MQVFDQALMPVSRAHAGFGYTPATPEYLPPAGLGIELVKPVSCKNWLHVYTAHGEVTTLVSGYGFGCLEATNYFSKYGFMSAYFIFKNDVGTYLFRFIVQNKQYVIQVCTDGMRVTENKSGQHIVYPKSGVSGLPTGGAMEAAFNVDVAPVGFGDAGRAPAGVGQLIDGVTLQAISSSSVPPVYPSDWIEFYPNDPYGYTLNTNLGYGALPQQGYGLINQINSSAPGSTVYWLLTDPNQGSAWTISTLGANAYRFDSVALIRSSYPAGKLKLEIARTTVPAPMALVSGASFPGPLPGGLTWETTNIASATGKSVAMPSVKQTEQATYYLQYLGQPQFSFTMPESGQTWNDAEGQPGYAPVPTPMAPYSYFSYGGQIYRIASDGTVYVNTKPIVKKPAPKPLPPPAKAPKPLPIHALPVGPLVPAAPRLGITTTLPIQMPAPPSLTSSAPAWMQPGALPAQVQSGVATSLQAQQATQTAQQTQAGLAAPSMPVVFEIALGMLALGVVGGVALLVLE